LIALLTIVPSAIVGWALTGLIAAFQERGTFVVLVVAASAAPIAVLWICDANVLIARGRNAAFALVNLVPSAVYVVTILAGWSFAVLSVPFVIAANLVGTVATYLVTTSLVRVGVTGRRLPILPMVRQGLSFAGSQISEAASYRLDQVIALPLLGAGPAGLYSVAATIALIPYSIGQAIGAASFRQLATADSREQRVESSAAVVRIGMFSGSVCAVALAAVAPVAVPWIFGPEFEGAVAPTIWGLVGSVAVILAYVSSSALTASGTGWAMTISQVAGLLVGVGALFILGPLLSSTGAAIASSLGYWVCAALCVGSLRLPASTVVPRFGDARSSFRMLVKGRF
jgi:O-antigen/teichoic acid export membrane protein